MHSLESKWHNDTLGLIPRVYLSDALFLSGGSAVLLLPVRERSHEHGNTSGHNNVTKLGPKEGQDERVGTRAGEAIRADSDKPTGPKIPPWMTG